MAKVRASLLEVSFLTRRMVEWSIVVSTILVLVLVFARQVSVLKGQAELSAVKSMLGALRVAFVIDHLHKSMVVVNSSVALVQHNPFELLQRQPGNYLGEMKSTEAAAAPAGSWVFDPVCVCIGYLPLHSEWFDSPSGDVLVWFRVGGEPGTLQLTAKEAYVWQGQVMN